MRSATRLQPALLRALRNSIPVDSVIAKVLELPHKRRDGHFRFLCPRCGDFHTAVNPDTNLARCFRCRTSYNPIDIVIAARNCSFLQAVQILLQRLPPAK